MCGVLLLPNRFSRRMTGAKRDGKVETLKPAPEFLEKHETLFLDVTANCGGNFAKPAAKNPDDPVLQERWDRVSRNCERLVEELDDALPWW